MERHCTGLQRGGTESVDRRIRGRPGHVANVQDRCPHGWKWWQRDCPCAEVASLPSAAPWSHRLKGMHRRKDRTDGVALLEARKDKEATDPELCEGNGRAELVVTAGEVGGRWSQETKLPVVFGV